MFDDQVDVKTAPPINLPIEPEDMFAGVEKNAGALPVPEDDTPDALAAGMLKRKQPEAEVMPTLPGAQSGPPVETTYTMKTPILGKVIFIVLLVAILGGTAFAGWWAYSRYFAAGDTKSEDATSLPAASDIGGNIPADQPATPTNDDSARNNTAAPTTPTDIPSQIKNDSILFGEAVDNDKDGLDDIREQEIGTSPTQADSDGDGLTDGEEVITWKTYPLNPDSDGDTHMDGKEVANGYNPLGPGKLVPASTSTTATTSPK